MWSSVKVGLTSGHLDKMPTFLLLRLWDKHRRGCSCAQTPGVNAERVPDSLVPSASSFLTPDNILPDSLAFLS